MMRSGIAAAMLLATLPLAASAQTKSSSSMTQKPSATSQSNDILPFKATEKTLPNGLKIIVVPTGFPNIVSLQIPVQTGSRNEFEPGKSGFAHFFEHMMFRGTKQYSPEQYNEIITKAGARQNAYTTDDYTNYHTTFAKEDLDEILKIEADRFQNLSYSPEAFKTESKAVLGEYNKNSASPTTKLDEVMRNAAFTTHTYKHTTMGFIEDIENMPNQYDYSKEFFNRWYRPENTTIIVAGDVDPAKVIPMIEKYWGGWKPGNYKATIPVEPPAKGPVYTNVPWSTETLPWVTVNFHVPGFSDAKKDYAAIDMLFDLYFGDTSDFHKKLVEDEQKVDQVFAGNSGNIDPSLAGVWARVKDPKDALYVRDEILRTYAKAKAELVDPQRLADAKSNARYGFIRSLDNTEAIAGTLARYVRFYRKYDTLNNYYRVYASLTPEDIRKAANDYFTDANMVVATLSSKPLDEKIKTQPALSSMGSATSNAAANNVDVLTIKSPLPQIAFKLVFNAGSAHDPKGKEGLAALAAAMIAEAGSSDMRTDEISKALFPIAGSFDDQVDKEMTTFTGRIHRDNWNRFKKVALTQLTSPGFRQEDFDRLRDAQVNALTQDLRANNEEELGKEQLQDIIFDGTPYGHPVLGTVAGLKNITLDDVKNFVKTHFTQGNVVIGISGDYSDEILNDVKAAVAALPAAGAQPPTQVAGKRPSGLNVNIIQKDTRATAISFGVPIAVTRSHPDYPALSVARAWLGEHRSSMSHLYQRIREIRGMNYGDYSYIEAFPRGMFQFFPDPNLARRAQIFEVWIRPVVPTNAHFALRTALYEVNKLIDNGMSKEDFETVRNYLMKNVYVTTATQNQQLGYALDSKWYGIPEYTKYMRDSLSKLTVDDVNRAIKTHLSGKDLDVVIITKDADALKNALITDAPSPMKYDSDKPADLLAEDKVIEVLKLNIKPENVTITPVEQVFAK